MAVKGPINAAVRMPSGSYITEVTLPPESLCHYITDDELDRLSEMRKEPVMEIFLSSIGAFLGGLVPAVQEIAKFQADSRNLTGVGLFTMFVAVSALSAAVISGFLWHQRGKSHKSMSGAIRDRPRVRVHHG
ncbi:hypothetical protein [uncultured Novosphingobium sp.]|uniref:hypothetical protein n=1 Tax=uncultured Novosphingobium sp. TaxID=292277 RepID=UPI00258D647C|nr:hypothetical protein [uncultured Novosphingobium sp.]